MQSGIRSVTELEALFRATFEESSVPCWIIDLDSMEFLDVNASAVEKYGYHRDTFLSNDLRLLRPNDAVKALADDYAQIAREGVPQPRRHRRADGEWLNVDVSLRRVSLGGRDTAVAQILDASSLQSVQEEIERTYKRVTKILGCAFDAVVSIDGDSNIIEWSGESEGIFGWNSQEVLGRKMHEVIMPERYRAQHLEGLNRYYVTGKAKLLDQVVQIFALRKDGSEFPVDLRITRVDRVSSFDFTAFIRDRTVVARPPSLEGSP